MEYSVQINGQMASKPESGQSGDQGNREIPALSKLKGLHKDDKTENAMLRSRIDEQSQLIMILKGRADEHLLKLQTLERVNKELVEFRDNAKEELQHEMRKFNLLDARFNDLAENHEEMIKFKDEYKRVNKELRLENEKLKDENARLFSDAINEKDETIRTLEGKLVTAREQMTNLDTKYRHSVQESRTREEGLRKEIRELQERLKTEVKALQHKLSDTEERLKGANYKLQNQIDIRQNADSEASSKIQQLTKEKDELLELAMQRGKIIQNQVDFNKNADLEASIKIFEANNKIEQLTKEKEELLELKEQNDNKQLKKRIAEMEKAVKNMEEKFERECASVNANIQVRKLKTELEEAASRATGVTQEFDAYKKHTSALLKKEKELNERLRHLCG